MEEQIDDASILLSSKVESLHLQSSLRMDSLNFTVRDLANSSFSQLHALQRSLNYSMHASEEMVEALRLETRKERESLYNRSLDAIDG